MAVFHSLICILKKSINFLPIHDHLTCVSENNFIRPLNIHGIYHFELPTVKVHIFIRGYLLTKECIKKFVNVFFLAKYS